MRNGEDIFDQHTHADANTNVANGAIKKEKIGLNQNVALRVKS